MPFSTVSVRAVARAAATICRLLWHPLPTLLALAAATSAGLALAQAAPGTVAAKTLAAQTAANSHAACTAIAPFYWEIGDKTQTQANGSVGNRWAADTSMHIASATKWLYGAYVAELRRGQLTPTDIQHLNFTSGYSSFKSCGNALNQPGETVASCAQNPDNNKQTPSHLGRFFYAGGHMQLHAAQQTPLANSGNAALALQINNMLKLDASAADFEFAQPQLAGGAKTTPAVYAHFLRTTLRGELYISQLLGSHVVCTNPGTCPTAVSTPFPHNESPLYSIGHWVEPAAKDGVSSAGEGAGDGAFTSPGLFGFYPWIDAGKQWYGIVARATLEGTRSRDMAQQPYYLSMVCGREIRKAWMAG